MQQQVKFITSLWEKEDQFKGPESLHDCVSFIVTEAAEALEEVLRLNPSYVRNNPRDGDLSALDEEVIDTLFMCLVYCNKRDISAKDLLEKKLREMDYKRGGIVFGYDNSR